MPVSGSGFARIKRVIPDDISSGSEHSRHHDDDCAASPSLSDLVYGFLMDDAGTESLNSCDSDSERDPSANDSVDGDVDDWIKPVVFNFNGDGDSFRSVLYSNVSKAVDVFGAPAVAPGQVRRSVMAFLRNLGYNAAVCKTAWEGSGGLTAGNYEFVDVLRSDSGNRVTRYFIDLEFAREFEIARPTAKYQHAAESVPRVFVGKSEELKQVLRVMSDAARRSLKSRDLHLPPWRKHRYMQNKWFGPYKRTTNVFPAATGFSSQTALNQNCAVKCRAVGFDVSAGNGRLLLFPATTNTR